MKTINFSKVIIIITIFFSSCINDKPKELLVSSYDNGNPYEKSYVLNGNTIEKRFFYKDGKIKRRYIIKNNHITKLFLFSKDSSYSITHIENGKFVGNRIAYYRDGRIMQKLGFLLRDMDNDTIPSFTTFYSYDTIGGKIILKKIDAFRKKRLKESQDGWSYSRMATLYFNDNGSVDSINSNWTQVIGLDTIKTDEDYKFSIKIYHSYYMVKNFSEIIIGKFDENIVPMKVVPGVITDSAICDTITGNSGYKDKFYFTIKGPFKKGYNYFHGVVRRTANNKDTANIMYYGEQFFIKDFFVK